MQIKAQITVSKCVRIFSRFGMRIASSREVSIWVGSPSAAYFLDVWRISQTSNDIDWRDRNLGFGCYRMILIHRWIM